MRVFKNIRKQLSAENLPDRQAGSVAKYFRYAFGEIVLVVIGILIALQINNWNNARQARDYEIKMLKEVRKSLQNDIKDKSDNLQLFKKAEYSVNELLKMRDDANYPRDSVVTCLTSIKNLGLFFPYTDGGFKAIESNGLDKISNDSLRNALVHLYSYTLPSISIFVNQIARPNMMKKYALFDQIFPSVLKPEKDGKAKRVFSYTNFEKILHTRDFDELLKLSNLVATTITPRLEYLVAQMNQLDNLISKEIGGKDVFIKKTNNTK